MNSSTKRIRLTKPVHRTALIQPIPPPRYSMRLKENRFTTSAVFNDVPVEIVKDHIASFMAHTTLINFSRTSKMYHPLLKRYIVKNMRSEFASMFPAELFQFGCVTGGVLLSGLTDGYFHTKNIDFLIKKKINEVHLIEMLWNQGWEQVPSTVDADSKHTRSVDLVRNGTRLTMRSMLSQTRVRGSPIYNPEKLIQTYDLSIARLWFNGKELYIEDAVNTLNLENQGYKSMLMTYAVSEPDKYGMTHIIQSKFSHEMEKKYRRRGYLIGYGPRDRMIEPEDIEGNEDEEIF